MEYLRKLERARKIEEFKRQTQREFDAEDEEPNIMKPKLEENTKSKIMAASALVHSKSH